MSAWEKVKRQMALLKVNGGELERLINAARAEDAERLKQVQIRLSELSHCTDCGLIWTGNNLDCPACIAQAAALSVSQLCVERDALRSRLRAIQNGESYLAWCRYKDSTGIDHPPIDIQGYEERAAIREYEGGQPRLIAERGAQEDIKRILQQSECLKGVSF